VKFELQETIGKYPVIREIGSGATSRVYLARDTFADREVAIKVLLPGKGADAETERMMHKSFMTEASLAGKLNHPHIVDIYDAVIEAERSYLVMEYVPGVTLEAHSSANNLLPVGKVVEIVFKCIRALEYAHNHGIIHRDIKPGNILLSKDGEAKVSDFGAAYQQRQGLETSQMAGIGSPAYMSPEQIRMEKLTAQSDIYSLGVTMFRLLTGRLPFEASSYAGLTHAVLNADTPKPSTLRATLPELLDRIVMKSMAKEPGERYKSWLEFGKDLSQAFTSLRLAGDQVSESEKFDRLRGMPFFMNFGDVALWEVVHIGTWTSLPTNTTIIREGEQGDSFYLLVEGEVSVTLLGKQITTIKPGGCFGELLYFADRGERRTTTITSLVPITIMEIKTKALDASTDGCQVGFNKAFMKVLIDRLVQANRMIAQRI
jgi:eukaryotic-like serine/threonine-protein kinase